MRIARFALNAALGLGVIVLVLTQLAPSKASSPLIVLLKDECDPATFAFVPGGCTRTEGTPFPEFAAEVAQDHKVDGWEFDPDDAAINVSETVKATNIGGEFHTFTPVAAFGNGFVPALNNPADGAVIPECIPPAVFGTLVVQNASTMPVAVSAGIHRFQCCIHPWMRTTITAKP